MSEIHYVYYDNPAEQMYSRLRRSRRVGKARKTKKGGFKTLRIKADNLFSIYIRERDKWRCTICGATRDFATIQNGHYVKRGKWSVRFDEVNCNALCSKCNWRDNSHHHYYEKAIRMKWGDRRVNEMLLKTEAIVNRRQVVLDVIKRYG